MDREDMKHFHGTYKEAGSEALRMGGFRSVIPTIWSGGTLALRQALGPIFSPLDG